ncbi:MAG: class I SAM-dependent methyltransferase [Desulfobacteraceae bacterium]|nr:class I SAM-dependent methyltransferase [Desulfobacteraceae bacterium]
MRFPEKVCYALVRAMKQVPLLDQFHKESFISEDIYYDTVFQDAARSYAIFDSLVSFQNKRILDVGCGVGARTSYYAQQNIHSITGTDINTEMLEKAQRLVRIKNFTHPVKINFHPCDPGGLPFDDQKFDIVIMDCVFEHLSDPETVLNECMRVLKPGGFICIDFQPWLNPHGAHIDNLIPIPWNHILFSQKTLINVAARIYDTDDFRAGFWDFHNGGKEKKKNKWRYFDQLPELNFMTIKKFNQLIKESGYTCHHYSLMEYGNFNKKWIRTLASLFNKVLMGTMLKEYFTRYIICILKKEAEESID